MWQTGQIHRENEASIYGIDPKIRRISRWSCETTQIKVAQHFVETTVLALRAATRSTSPLEKTLRDQLKDLATMVLAMWLERYDYLKRSVFTLTNTSLLFS
jgi:hypothetical protein